MFSQPLVKFTSSLLLLGIATAVAGCSSAPPMQSVDLKENVHDSAEKLEQSATALQNTLIPLRQILDGQSTDVQEAYGEFSTGVDSFEDVANDLRELAENRADETAEYMADTDEQISGIQDQKLREESRTRRREIAASVNALGGDYDKVRDELNSVTTGLTDIRKALSVDLSGAGIDAIRSPAKAIMGRIEDLRDQLNALAVKHRKLEAELGSTYG